MWAGHVERMEEVQLTKRAVDLRKINIKWEERQTFY